MSRQDRFHLELPSLELCAIKELAQRDQWVLFRAKPNKSRIQKVPITPTGSPASVRESNTWSSFQRCAQAFVRGLGEGLGFVFTESDPYVGIDLDDCLPSPTPGVERLIRELGSYSEISPSGRGVHIIARGSLPYSGRRQKGIEVYASKRFFTVTGRLYPDSPEEINSAGSILSRLFSLSDAPSSSPIGPIVEFPRSVSRLLPLDSHLERLLTCDFRAFGKPSESEVDMTLAHHLRRSGVSPIDAISTLEARRRRFGPRKSAAYFVSTVQKAFGGGRSAHHHAERLVGSRSVDPTGTLVPPGVYSVGYQGFETASTRRGLTIFVHFRIAQPKVYAGLVLMRCYEDPKGRIARQSKLGRDYLTATGLWPPSGNWSPADFLAGCEFEVAVDTVGSAAPYSRISRILKRRRGIPPLLRRRGLTCDGHEDEHGDQSKKR